MRQISGQHLVTETAADSFGPAATALATDGALPKRVRRVLLPLFSSLQMGLPNTRLSGELLNPLPLVIDSPRDARVYFMHNVLHDWTDELVAKILGNVVGAMERGHSRLLTNECLISSVKPLANVTVSDITMMACLSAKERTEDEWTHLVEQAGLKVVKIWKPPHSVQIVIEAKLV